MAEKIAVYIGEPLAAVLQGHEAHRSARINQVAAGYIELVREATPALAEDEWMAVLDALNGTALQDDTTLRHAWADVADATGLGERWGIDQDALVQRVRGMSRSQLIALREVVSAYWDMQPSELAPAQALQQAGARLAGDA